MRAPALLADVRLPPEYWPYACSWVAYVYTHRVTEIAIGKALPNFGDVVVVHQALKKPPPFENRVATGVCLGYCHMKTGLRGGGACGFCDQWDCEVCSAKVRRLGEKVGQAWRLHVHLQDSTKAAYDCSTGEVKWNLTEIEVPTVEHCIREDTIEVQDIRELGMGWAWIMNDLRAFLPAWQDMELASPLPADPISQIDDDVPLEPIWLRAETADLDLGIHSHERPLAASPFGTPVPDWDDTHAMTLDARLKS